MKRIALYWHNGRSLGHTSRASNLAKAYMEVLPDTIVAGITGASKGLSLLPHGMDYLKLPSYISIDHEAGVERHSIIEMPDSEFYVLRSELIQTFIRHYSPHVFVVDHHPQGRRGELTNAVINSPNSRKILSLRGIMKSKQETYDRYFSPDILEFTIEHFLEIHVHIDPSVFRLEEFYDVPDSFKAKIKYTGYLGRRFDGTKLEARHTLGLDSQERIIVVSLGGGQATEAIWLGLLESLQRTENRFDHAYLFTGPYLHVAAQKQLEDLTRNNPKISTESFTDTMHIWMKASDLFIGAGGYNTLCEIIVNEINALVIPRHLSDNEQQMHTQLLEQRGILRVAQRHFVEDDALGFSQMLIESLLYPRSSKGKGIMRNGAYNSALSIQKLLL